MSVSMCGTNMNPHWVYMFVGIVGLFVCIGNIYIFPTKQN